MLRRAQQTWALPEFVEGFQVINLIMPWISFFGFHYSTKASEVDSGLRQNDSCYFFLAGFFLATFFFTAFFLGFFLAGKCSTHLPSSKRADQPVAFPSLSVRT